jgi:hypothetical protein
MIRFLIDEDLPRSTAKVLREAGFESIDVRDIGLRGAKDDVIYRRMCTKRPSVRSTLFTHPPLLTVLEPLQLRNAD